MTIRLMRHASVWLLVGLAMGACGDEKKSSDTNGDGPCVELGDTCGPRGASCCPADEGTVQCIDGSCDVCAAVGEECGDGDSDLACCNGRTCAQGLCCTTGSCESDADCCGGQICNATIGNVCCIPSGQDTTYTPDCCSGSGRERFCTHPADGKEYHCGTECL